MKKYKSGGKLPKAQTGQVVKKAMRYRPGLINERDPKYKKAKKVVKKYLSGRIPRDPDLPDHAGDFKKKAEKIRSKFEKGGSLKSVPSGKKFNGLRSLPTEVRNKMGYAKYGMKMMKGGSLRRSMKHK